MHPKVLEIAEVELRETESRKNQFLQQFKDWLEKHPFIVSSRRDDMFLLSFLRLTKYNLDRACQRYEKTFLNMIKYPNIFSKKDADLKKILEVVKRGYIYPVPGFDDEGCKIFIIRICQRDPDLISAAMAIECAAYIVSTLYSEHENQITKYKLIIDYKNATMKNMLNIMENKIIMELLQSALSVRISKIILVNLHPIVQGLAELIKTMTSEKMRSRTITLKNLSDLSEHITPISNLPTIFGGQKNEKDITESLLKDMSDNREKFVEMLTYELVEDKIPKSKLANDESDHVGSFVKLEID